MTAPERAITLCFHCREGFHGDCLGYGSDGPQCGCTCPDAEHGRNRRPAEPPADDVIDGPAYPVHAASKESG